MRQTPGCLFIVVDIRFNILLYVEYIKKQKAGSDIKLNKFNYLLFQIYLLTDAAERR